MDCGITLQSPTVNDLLSYIGLGKEQEGTPSTVGLEQDDKDNRDAAISALSKQLTYASWLPNVCQPNVDTNDTRNQTSEQKSQLTPQQCRGNKALCVDCARHLDGCICGDKKTKLLPKTCNTPECSASKCSDCKRCRNHCVCHCRRNRVSNQKQSGISDDYSKISFTEAYTDPPPQQLSIQTKQALLAGSSNPQIQLRKSPSLLSSSSGGSIDANVTAMVKKLTDKTPTPNKKKSRDKSGRRSRRYNMGDEGQNTKASGQNKNSTNKNGGNSRRYDMGDDGGEYIYLTHHMLEEHSRRSFNSSDTSSYHSYYSYNSSNPRSCQYTMGENDERNYNNNQAVRLHQRSESGRSSSSRRSSNRSGSRLSFSSQIRQTFSLSSDRSSTSNRSRSTRSSASTARRVNSNSSHSSASQSYLEYGFVETQPKKSWFGLRSKE